MMTLEMRIMREALSASICILDGLDRSEDMDEDDVSLISWCRDVLSAAEREDVPAILRLDPSSSVESEEVADHGE